jgi:pantetheine-phosphate adenylyltransferase
MKRALYAGSFDPITLGHVSVIERGAQLFDELVVVVAVNPAKAPLFSAEERTSFIRLAAASLGNVSVTSTAGYVVELARDLGARYLIRGVRGVTDMAAELELSRLNRELAPEIETVFVTAHPELSEVSSSLLKERAREGADFERYCPPHVAARLTEVLLG